MLPSLSLAFAVLFGEAIDRLAQPVRPFASGGNLALAFRGAVIALIWLTAFGLTGRALFALAATVVTIAIIVAISNIKRRYLREPLVFSDFALLEHFLRHPRLFYVSGGWMAALIASVLVLIGATAIWLAIEPRATGPWIQATALAVVLAAVVAVWFGSGLRAAAARLVPKPNAEADVGRIGLLASLAAYATSWRHGPAPLPRPSTALAPPYDAIVVIQAEAFVDLRRHGCADLRLPAFDRLKARARACGLLEVSCQGAYTLRPESAVITGLGFHDQGFDGFHPYLRPQRLAGAALPQRLARSGWHTLFVHPHDASFFRRDRAMPVFGFNEFVDVRAFAGAQRVGPHVADEAVCDFLLAQIRTQHTSGHRLFTYAVTMEAHDPYGPGRLPEEDNPIRQYIHHIENADRMLDRLASEIDRGDQRVLLVFFGDHVPFLPSFADPFIDTRTDYLVVELGRGASAEPIGVAVSRPEHLCALIENSAQQSQSR